MLPKSAAELYQGKAENRVMLSIKMENMIAPEEDFSGVMQVVRNNNFIAMYANVSLRRGLFITSAFGLSSQGA
jgi:hypothetical protein